MSDFRGSATCTLHNVDLFIVFLNRQLIALNNGTGESSGFMCNASMKISSEKALNKSVEKPLKVPKGHRPCAQRWQVT